MWSAGCPILLIVMSKRRCWSTIHLWACHRICSLCWYFFTTSLWDTLLFSFVFTFSLKVPRLSQSGFCVSHCSLQQGHFFICCLKVIKCKHFPESLRVHWFVQVGKSFEENVDLTLNLRCLFAAIVSFWKWNTVLQCNINHCCVNSHYILELYVNAYYTSWPAHFTPQLHFDERC